ncbi:MAG TPA: cytochrome c [Nevskiaceae bacterium]
MSRCLALGGLVAAALLTLPAMAADHEANPPAKVKDVCAACHGVDGIGKSPIYPNLAGQYKDYIEQALREYQHNERVNPIMTPMAKPLTADQITAVATWYSQQKPKVYTPDINQAFVPRAD